MRNFIGPLLVVLLLSLSVKAGEAPADWALITGCGASLETLSLKLNTEIRAPLSESLAHYLKSCPQIKTLELRFDSSGGSIFEASRIVQVLDQAKAQGIHVITRVDNGDECDSSCIPLYAQGETRQAGPVAAFMFHGVALYVVSNIPDVRATTELLSMVRKAKGLNGKWLDGLIAKEIFSVPSMYWVSGQELADQKTGFVTELLERQQLFKPYDRNYRRF